MGLRPVNQIGTPVGQQPGMSAVNESLTRVQQFRPAPVRTQAQVEAVPDVVIRPIKRAPRKRKAKS